MSHLLLTQLGFLFNKDVGGSPYDFFIYNYELLIQKCTTLSSVAMFLAQCMQENSYQTSYFNPGKRLTMPF